MGPRERSTTSGHLTGRSGLEVRGGVGVTKKEDEGQEVCCVRRVPCFGSDRGTETSQGSRISRRGHG